ncbi:uncharacterized protein [Haliotis asinina]|uniref:uncharacterized protein n=1 Tax=Haliotis asinina TaxID=109174 RepID=UPI0035318FB3
MYMKMKIPVLFFTLMWVRLAPSASQDLKYVYMNGSSIQVHQKTLCYQQRYDVMCDKDWFAPIKNTFSLKEPAFSSANNCTGQRAYPSQCCNVDPNDCNFTSIKDFDQIRQVCSGKTHCKGQRAPWHPVYETRPNMNCKYQLGLTHVLTTQYVTTEYMCAPYQSIQQMCVKGTKKGKGLFLSSKDYPLYYSQQTGFNCSCKVEFGQAVLKVAAIDLRLCSSSNRCGRSLSIGKATRISVTNTQEKDPSLSDSIFGIVGMEEIYSAPSATGHLTVELKNVDSKEALYLWMYLYAEGSDITVTCDGETTFTTPTTTTTTTTTTTPSTSTTPTTPTTPTRSTMPTTTSDLTTPVTTTPTTATTTATTNAKFLTPKPVVPNISKTNIGCNYDQLCNCERVTALSQKMYYIELAASALGGIVFTAVCWCTYSMCHKHNKAKKPKALKREKVTAQHQMHRVRKNYLNNDARSVYSIEPCDSASQVGGARTRKDNYLNRNEQAVRQAQKANQRGSNQSVPRKISVTHDVPNEYDELEKDSTKIKDEEVQSNDDIINKLADRLKEHPAIENVIRHQAKERVNCHYETDINDETDIKIILGGFGLEILQNTLSEMDSHDQNYSF